MLWSYLCTCHGCISISARPLLSAHSFSIPWVLITCTCHHHLPPISCHFTHCLNTPPVPSFSCQVSLILHRHSDSLNLRRRRNHLPASYTHLHLRITQPVHRIFSLHLPAFFSPSDFFRSTFIYQPVTDKRLCQIYFHPLPHSKITTTRLLTCRDWPVN